MIPDRSVSVVAVGVCIAWNLERSMLTKRQNRPWTESQSLVQNTTQMPNQNWHLEAWCCLLYRRMCLDRAELGRGCTGGQKDL